MKFLQFFHRLAGFGNRRHIMEKFKAGIVGATGMVGQRFITLISDHPWFELKVLAASARSAGKTF